MVAGLLCLGAGYIACHGEVVVTVDMVVLEMVPKSWIGLEITPNVRSGFMLCLGEYVTASI